MLGGGTTLQRARLVASCVVLRLRGAVKSTTTDLPSPAPGGGQETGTAAVPIPPCGRRPKQTQRRSGSARPRRERRRAAKQGLKFCASSFFQQRSNQVPVPSSKRLPRVPQQRQRAACAGAAAAPQPAARALLPMRRRRTAAPRDARQPCYPPPHVTICYHDTIPGKAGTVRRVGFSLWPFPSTLPPSPLTRPPFLRLITGEGDGPPAGRLLRPCKRDRAEALRSGGAVPRFRRRVSEPLGVRLTPPVSPLSLSSACDRSTWSATPSSLPTRRRVRRAAGRGGERRTQRWLKTRSFLSCLASSFLTLFFFLSCPPRHLRAVASTRGSYLRVSFKVRDCGEDGTGRECRLMRGWPRLRPCDLFFLFFFFLFSLSLSLFPCRSPSFCCCFLVRPAEHARDCRRHQGHAP